MADMLINVIILKILSNTILIMLHSWIYNALSEPIKAIKGFRQNSSHSQILFNIYLKKYCGPLEKEML